MAATRSYNEHNEQPGDDVSVDIYPKDVREFRLFSAKGKPHRQISSFHTTIAAQRMPAFGPTGEPYGVQTAVARRRLMPRSMSLDERQLCDALPSDGSPTPSFHFWRLTTREKLLLLSFGFGDFLIFLCFSVIAPFFPAEVSRKGGSTTMAGMIFAQYALISCIAAPIFGHMLPHFGARWTLLMGLFVSGAANIIFGKQMSGYTELKTFVRKTVNNILNFTSTTTAYATSSYALLAHEFPDFIVPAFGILEAFVGLGLTAGPALGGLLYAYGGYKLPFVLLGGLVLLSPAVFYWVLPAEPQHIKLPRAHYSGLLCNPKALAVSFVITVTSAVWSFFDPILEPHLRPLNLSVEVLGLLFLLTAATYTISSPFWGWFGERLFDQSETLMIIGMLLTAMVMMLFGPSPLIAAYLNESLWLNVVCLACLGLFVSMAIIPTFDCLLTAALENADMDENFATYSLVSGLWSASYSLGEVIGPLFGGVIFDHYGFPTASTIMAALSALAALVLIVEAARRRISRYRRTQRFLKYGPSPPPPPVSSNVTPQYDEAEQDDDGRSVSTNSSTITIEQSVQRPFYSSADRRSTDEPHVDAVGDDGDGGISTNSITAASWVGSSSGGKKSNRRRRRSTLFMRQQTAPLPHRSVTPTEDNNNGSTPPPIVPFANPAAAPAATSALLTLHHRLPHQPYGSTMERPTLPLLDSFLCDTQRNLATAKSNNSSRRRRQPSGSAAGGDAENV